MVRALMVRALIVRGCGEDDSTPTPARAWHLHHAGRPGATRFDCRQPCGGDDDDDGTECSPGGMPRRQRRRAWLVGGSAHHGGLTVDIKRNFSMALALGGLVGAGSLVGCKTPIGGGLGLFNKDDAS